MRGALLAGAVTGVVALAASAAASFWLVSQWIALPDAPRPCSIASGMRCFGSVAAGDVVGPLRTRGFLCNDVPTCDLWAGGGAYSVHLLTLGGGVSAYRVEVRFDRSLGPSQRALDLVSWLAALPFGHDAATASAARAWTLQQVRARAYALATINGYGYEVEGRGDQAGSTLPTCQPGADCAVALHGYLRLAVQVGGSP
jgi:hypothetical protein